MKFLIGALIFVVCFSALKAFSNPSDLDKTLSNTSVATSAAAKKSAIAELVK